MVMMYTRCSEQDRQPELWWCIRAVRLFGGNRVGLGLGKDRMVSEMMLGRQWESLLATSLEKLLAWL